MKNVNKNSEKIKPGILQKQGKTIFDEVHFRSVFAQKLQQYPYKSFSLVKTLRESLKGQQLLGGLFVESFKKIKGNPYTKDYLHYPWPFAEKYKLLHDIFLHHPVFIEPFLNAVSQYFYHPVIKSWRDVQSISCFKKTSDYCARALPGTKEAAQDRAQEASDELVSLVHSDVPKNIVSHLIAGYDRFFNKRWETYGGALLPLGYLKGTKSYGRLKSVPPSTLCNMNKEVKLIILGAIKANHKISFMEIDLKSCHAKIFQDLFDWDGFDRNDLPPLDKLWDNMISDFWEKVNEIAGYDHIKLQITKWPEGHLKGLLKNQFYKALNGGLPDYAEDNVERSKTKLKIELFDQPDFNEFLHLVFNRMKVFQLETAFIEQVNSHYLLYLPNYYEGFETDTLSKTQLKKIIADPNYEPRKQTGNSRLFSNMELCLIFHLYAAITEANCGWLVIGYEADGILVAGEMDETQANRDLEKVSKIFKESIKGLTTAQHSLDIKNFI